MTQPQTFDFDHMLSESNARPPGKARRGLILGVVAFFLAVLVGVVVFVDGAARGVAEDAVESELANRLPDGSGPITASIGGFSFLTQFFSGSLDQLDVSFAVDGTALGSLTGPEGAASPIELSGGVMTYTSALQALGLELGYRVTLEPSVDGGYLVLTPTGIETTTENAAIDIGQFVNLEELSMRVCAAELLPEGMDLTETRVVDSRLHLDVSGQGIPIDIDALKTRGTCG